MEFFKQKGPLTKDVCDTLLYVIAVQSLKPATLRDKFFIHSQGTAFVTADQFALLSLVGILYIVCTAFQTGRNRLAFVFVQRDQPCRGHPKSPP